MSKLTSSQEKQVRKFIEAILSELKKSSKSYEQLVKLGQDMKIDKINPELINIVLTNLYHNGRVQRNGSTYSYVKPGFTL
jgi:K+-sensing histidine kinase KdpD